MAQPDFSPSAERNKQPILEVLQTFLPAQGTALEIASGTGQHVVWFAQNMPLWTWQPTEVHHGALYNIEVRATEADLANVNVALPLDVCKVPWQLEDTPFDLVLCLNMLHIAPWDACSALMHGAATHLAPGGRLVTYGPYFEDGVAPTQSNVEFDQSLRAHDPSWGIRLLGDVQQQATAAGLALVARHSMPANNLLLVWERAGAARAPLTLRPVNANVVGVHAADGSHVGNLKRIGDIWKFKALGYDASGAVEPGGGPLTGQHNAEFAQPDADAVNARLGGALPGIG